MSCVGAACFSLPRRGGGSGPCTALNPLPHLLRCLFPALLQMSWCIFQPLGSAFTRVPHGHGCSRSGGELGPSPLDFIVTSFWGLAHPPIPVPSGWSPRPREKAPRAGKIWKIKFPLSSQWRRCLASPQLVLFLSDQPCLSCCLPSYFPS